MKKKTPADIIKKRIEKCERRIAKGYVAPEGQESEQSRLERLQAALKEME